VLISIEGIDGSGKTTIVELLSRKLEERGVKVYVTKEPSLSPIGRLIKEWALRESLHPAVDALLFAADRVHHFYSEIKPRIEEGFVVITERFKESSIVYQSLSGVEAEWVELINKYVPDPDLTVVIDVPPEVAISRLRRRGSLEKFENVDFLSRARELFLSRARERGYLVLSGVEDPEVSCEKLAELVLKALKQH